MRGSPVSDKDEPPVPSSTAAYFFREALRRIWISKRTSFLAIGMITMSLFILGLFLLISQNLTSAVDRWGSRSRMMVYLSVTATSDQIRQIDGFLRARPLFRKSRFVSREAALEKFNTHFSSLSPIVREIGDNPFPASFEVDLGTAASQTPSFRSEVAALRKLPGIDEIQFDWEWIAKLRSMIRVINTIGFVAGGILALAAAFTIANVIRLTMVLYREEIEIMRLVGATEGIIRGPFLAEGLLQGTIGGTLALGFLYLLLLAVRHLETPATALLWDLFLSSFLPWRISLALVGGGMLAGLAGSWLSLRERREDDA